MTTEECLLPQDHLQQQHDQQIAPFVSVSNIYSSGGERNDGAAGFTTTTTSKTSPKVRMINWEESTIIIRGGGGGQDVTVPLHPYLTHYHRRFYTTTTNQNVAPRNNQPPFLYPTPHRHCIFGNTAVINDTWTTPPTPTSKPLSISFIFSLSALHSDPHLIHYHVTGQGYIIVTLVYIILIIVIIIFYDWIAYSKRRNSSCSCSCSFGHCRVLIRVQNCVAEVGGIF